MTPLLCTAVSPAVESITKAMAGLVVVLLFVGVPCLAMVFLVGLVSLGRRDGRRVYERRATFLSENERAFYHSLHEAVAGRYAVFAQVRLADLLEIRPELSPPLRRAALLRVAAKHADFVLCEPRSLNLVGVIELDDRSHRRHDRQRRDAFFNETMAAAGLPLLRLAAKSTRAGYPVADVRAAVMAAFEKPMPSPGAAGISHPFPFADGTGGAAWSDESSRHAPSYPQWLKWLVPASLVAFSAACVLWAGPQRVSPPALFANSIPPTTAPVRAVGKPVAPIPAPSAPANDGTGWTRLMIQARNASEQWQLRAETLARQSAAPLLALAPAPTQEANSLAQAHSDQERFEAYDQQGKRWREYAQALDLALARNRPLPPPVSLTPTLPTTSNGLPTDEEIAARARANAGTYAPPQAVPPGRATVNPLAAPVRR